MMEPTGPDRAVANSIFGAELPQESTDERDVNSADDRDGRDRWLRDNVPPHHF
jgi:hypothetical protein